MLCDILTPCALQIEAKLEKIPAVAAVHDLSSEGPRCGLSDKSLTGDLTRRSERCASSCGRYELQSSDCVRLCALRTALLRYADDTAELIAICCGGDGTFNCEQLPNIHPRESSDCRLSARGELHFCTHAVPGRG